MAVNYVKFYRGTPLSFERVTKNKDTLYFISETDSNKGSLYLGEKIIGSNISLIADLEDISITDIASNQVLVYDEKSSKWVNKSLTDTVDIMTGATEAAQGSHGLVPAPGIGQQDFFLKGDGTWAIPTASSQVLSDDKTIEILDGKTLSLKDFGKRYYKFIAATGSVEEGNYVDAHYTLQIVDDLHPWLAGLEPKVIEENGVLVLGWFEPNPLTINDVSNSLTALQEQVNNVKQNVSTNTDSINTLTADVNTLNEQISNKANADSVYTRAETDTKISEAIASVGRLTRKVFETKLAAEEFAVSVDNPEDYIYMVANTGSTITANKYTEFVYIDGALEEIGTQDVNLEDYVTDVELALALGNKVNTKEGYSLVADTEIKKLAGIEAGAQKNYITSVQDSEFVVSETGQLSANSISIAKIENLQTLLNNKVDMKSSMYEGENVDWVLLSPENQAKLDSLVIGDNGNIEVSSKVNAENVEGLDTWINTNRDRVIGLYPSTDQNKLSTIQEGAQVNLIQSVDQSQMSIDSAGKLTLTSVPASIVSGLESAISSTAVGDLDSLIRASGKQDSTLVDEVNYINDRLQWKEMTE